MAQKRAKKKAPKQSASAGSWFDNPWVFPVIITLWAFVLYAGTLGHGFVLDDFSVIAENRIVQKGTDGIGEIFKTHYRAGYWSGTGTLYRPLTLSVFAVIWEVAGDNPAPFHWVIVIAYSLLCLTLFFLIVKIGVNRIIAFIASILFLSHPIHTEVGANIKSLDEILSVLFVSLAWLLLEKGNYEKIPNLIGSALLMFLGMLSKEGIATFIILLPLWMYFRGFEFKRWLLPMVSIAAPIAIYILIRANVLGESALSLDPSKLENPISKLVGLEHYLTAFKVLGLYLWKLVVPNPLVYEMAYNSITPSTASDAAGWLGFLVTLLLLVAGAVALWKRKAIGFWMLFILINLFLYSNLVIVIGSVYGERFLFWSSLGFCLILALLISNAAKRFQLSQNVLISIGLVIALTYSVLTINRNKAWESDYVLYSTDVKLLPNSAKAHYNYGLELMKAKALNASDNNEKNRYLNEAVQEFSRAIEIYKGYTDAYAQLALAKFRLNDYDEALKYYKLGLDRNPAKPKAWNNMGIIFFNRGDYQKAAECYQEAVKYDPYYDEAYGNLGACYGSIGNHPKAIEAFEQAIKINPQYAQCYQYAAISYQALGQNEKAQQYFNIAKQLNPKLGR